MFDHPTANQLLLWAMAVSEGDTTHWMRVDTWASSHPVPAVFEDMAEQAVSTLSAHSWVLEHRAITGKVIDFALTAAGVREAQRRLVAVASRRQRLAYAENAILTWVFDTAPPSRPVELIDFLESPTSVFYGSQLTAEEVTEASESLMGLKMLSITGGPPLTVAWLEPAGRSCVMSGQPVRPYVLATSGGVHNHPPAPRSVTRVTARRECGTPWVRLSPPGGCGAAAARSVETAVHLNDNFKIRPVLLRSAARVATHAPWRSHARAVLVSIAAALAGKSIASLYDFVKYKLGRDGAVPARTSDRASRPGTSNRRAGSPPGPYRPFRIHSRDPGHRQTPEPRPRKSWARHAVADLHKLPSAIWPSWSLAGHSFNPVARTGGPSTWGGPD